MKLNKAETRDKKRNKKNKGMQVDNKSIFILEEQKVKKGKLAKIENETKKTNKTK